MSATLIGIDVGTSSIKVGLFDTAGALLALESQGYRLDTPEKGWAQISADVLWSSLLVCLRRIAEKHTFAQTEGIGFSCMSPGLVGFSETGEVLAGPILYSDRRSGAEADWIRGEIGTEKMFSVTGNNVMAGAISVTSMLWLKRNRPEIYGKIRTFGHINTLMAYRMTGHMALDRSNASYTGLFDTVGTKNWSRELCKDIGIEMDKLPRVLDSQEVIGGLNAPEVTALGLRAGIPVVIGGADSPCASLACGVISPGDICQSVGTTNVLTICTDKPVFSREYLNRCHVVPDYWIYQGATSNGCSVVTWAREALCRDLEPEAAAAGENIFQRIHEETLQSVPGASGAIFLPYLAGERCPIWDSKAKGVFFGLSQETTRADLIRAVLESVCYSTKQLLGIAETLSDRVYDNIATVGGGAKSRIWTQMKADILERNMRVMELTDASVIGAAMLAGIGAGIFRDAREAQVMSQRDAEIFTPAPTAEEREIYRERYRVFEALYGRVKDLYPTA